MTTSDQLGREEIKSISGSPNNVPEIQSSHTEIKKIKRAHFLKMLESMAAIATFCLSSIFATIFQRYVLSDMKLGMNAILLICQCLLAVVFLFLLRTIGLIKFRILKSNQVLRWYPVSLGLVAMTYTGSKCLEFNAISIVTIFKNTSILLVAFGDLFFFKKKISLLTYFSFVLIIMSSMLGTITDSRVTFIGILWLVLNCLATAAYVLLLKGTLKIIKFKDFDTVFNNALLSLPVLFIISIGFDAWDKFLVYTSNPFVIQGPILIFSVFGVAFCTFMTAIGTAWVVRVTSPTTYSMTAALNKLPVSLGGILFLQSERTVTFMNIVGIGFGFISGLVYSISMVRQSNASLKKKEDDYYAKIQSSNCTILASPSLTLFEQQSQENSIDLKQLDTKV